MLAFARSAALFSAELPLFFRCTMIATFFSTTKTTPRLRRHCSKIWDAIKIKVGG